MSHTPTSFRFIALSFAFFVITFAVSVTNASAATFVVNSTADVIDAAAGNGICETATAGECTLRAAISEANALAGDDIITLPAGTYTQTLTGSENVNASGDWDVTSNITIDGAGAATTIIEAAATTNTAVERVMHFITAGTSVVNGVTFRNGRTTSGTFGGGVRVELAVNVTLNSVIIRDNVALGRGGGIYVVTSTSVLTVNNSTITNNQSSTNGVFSGSAGAAGVHQLNGTTTLNNTAVNNNTTAVVGSTATPPPSASGGGMNIIGGTMNLNNSSVNNNTATSAQSSAFGGGITMSGATTAVTLTNSTVNNNINSITAGTGSSNVGGINCEGGTLTLNQTTVSGNTAGSVGGIRVISGANAATANINQSAIVNNIATGSAGGIFTVATGAAAATTNINNSTVGGNTANVDGGGVLNYAQAAGNAITNITFSTVAGNTADADANATGNGGGLANFGNIVAGQTGLGTINLQSSVVGDNMNLGGTSPDIVNTITSLGYNHVENTTGGTFTTTAGDVTGTDPGLTPLALNGGTSLNYQPATTSPLLDTIPTGVNGCGVAPFNVDQRGAFRPTDSNNDTVAACEKGSIELLPPSAATASLSGRVTTVDGRGINNAIMSISGGSLAAPRFVRTGSFGYFTFDDLPTGETYVVTINSKRYTFTVPTRVIQVNDNVEGVDFVAEP